MPFTTRTHTEARETERQLIDLGYDFSRWNQGRRPLPDNFYDGVKVVNGMIFGNEGHPNAGDRCRALQALLTRLRQEVPAIGMVDHSEANLNEMARLIGQAAIPVHLFQYTGGKTIDTPKKLWSFYYNNVPGIATYEGYFDAIFN